MVVAADEAQRLGHVLAVETGVGPAADHRGREVAQQHQGAGAVAVVGLVAHLQHLGEDAGHVDGAGLGDDGAGGGLQQRAEHVAHPAQPGEHLGAVGAVAQHLAEPLVEGAVRPPAGRAVLEDPHPHGRRDDAGHRADRAAVVARLEADRAARLEERDRVLGVVDQALEGGAAHQRAAQRAGRPVPPDRRAGVQELARLEAEQLGRGCDVDEVGGDAEHRLDRPAVGLRAARVGGDRGEVGLGAGHRRTPVDALDVDGLSGHGVREHVGAAGDDRGGGGAAVATVGVVALMTALRSARWRGGWPQALEKCTSAPAATSASMLGVQALRVEVGADEADDHRDRPVRTCRCDGRREQSRPGRARRRGRARGRAGSRRCRVGGRPGQLLVAQGRVDHRVRAPLGQGVVAEVDHRVVVGEQVVAQREVGGQRDVAAGPDRAPRRRSASTRRRACRRRRARGAGGRSPGRCCRRRATGHAAGV